MPGSSRMPCPRKATGSGGLETFGSNRHLGGTEKIAVMLEAATSDPEGNTAAGGE